TFLIKLIKNLNIPTGLCEKCAFFDVNCMDCVPNLNIYVCKWCNNPFYLTSNGTCSRVCEEGRLGV
ncbi:MAG: hypothetical protein AAB262_07345, partial [Elusimicrobiota bacterium]